MTDENHANQDRSHWDELARQLGLEPEQSGRKPEAPAKPIRSPEPVAERSPETHAPEPAFEEDRYEAGPHEDRFEEIASEQPVEPHEAEEPAAEEPPQRRRGRQGRAGGRRGRRSRDETAAEPGDTGEVVAETPPQEETAAEQEPGRRRGRRRGRRDAEPVEGESKAEPAEEAAAAEEDDSIEEVDTLSDWNVPSWNELIASLYRPER